MSKKIISSVLMVDYLEEDGLQTTIAFPVSKARAEQLLQINNNYQKRKNEKTNKRNI